MDPSIGDLYEAFYAQLATSDRIFEFWITATFAVVVAVFFVGSKMSRTLYILLSCMYGVVSVNLMIRSYQAATKFVELRQQLLDAGEVMPSDELNTAVGLLTVLAYIAGTIGTLYFGWHTYKSKVQGEAYDA